MARKRDTGEGEQYSTAEERAIARAMERAYAAWGREDEPSKMSVRAQVEWAGEVMRANDGVRRVRLDQLSASAMGKVRAAVDKLGPAERKADQAKPSASRKAKGWHAQLRELVESPRGSEASDRAGLNPTARTLRNWLSDTDYPIRRSDQEKINRAYDELRNWNVTEAGKARDKAAGAVSDATTEALRERYGPNIRFRSIQDLTFE